jgi:uncharacterized protein YjbI with pentapeptide repeats
VKVFKDTPFEFGFLPWQVRPPRVSLMVVVKGTFTLRPDGVTVVADEQMPTSGPVHHDDDPAASLAWDTDFAVLKPRGECHLTGSCYAPGARPAASCMVSFSVGPVTRTLQVFGDRTWDAAGGVTGPEPFTVMPLRWERCFGGADHPRNPVGRGQGAVQTDRGAVRYLPNVEDPAHLVASMGDAPAPAGAFPLHPAWPQRVRKAGTYDRAWVKTRWPWFPDDFDWGYFNAAPDALQIQGYWRGDEEIVARNMHPTVPEVRGRLPGLRPRCFLELRRGEGVEFTAVALHLDTITVDPENLRAVCLWRGLVEVASEKLDDVETFYVLHEGLEEARTLEDFQALLDQRKREREAEDVAFEGEEPDEADLEIPPAPMAAPPYADAFRELLAMKLKTAHERPEEARATVALADQVAAALREAEAEPDAPAPKPSEVRAAMRAEGVAVPDEIEALEDPPEPPAEAEEEPAVAPLTREEVLRRRANEEVLAGEDLTGVDLSGTDLTGQDFTGAILTGALLKHCILHGVIFDQAVLQGADLSGSDCVGASFKETDLAEARGDDVVADGACFDGAIAPDSSWLRARFVGASLKGAELARAALDDADLHKATLDACEFEGASLVRCVFQEASLVDAAVEGARAAGANFEGADLTGLRASEMADFTDANLRGVKAEGAQFCRSTLDRANLSLSALGGVDFTGATLVGANLTGCVARKVRFQEASLVDAVLLRADLFEGNFEGADLTRADLRGANLFGAQLLRARLDGVRLELANVRRTSLDAAVQ